LKRALEELKNLKRGFSGVEIDEIKIERLFAKFYVKDRSIQVIMEMCNESPHVHKLLINFVIKRIFDKLSQTDYFSFTTLH
jgi:hypothetical protein